MIRKAYFEDPAYVPLVLRAYELWRDLERITGEELLRISGVLSVGRESSQIIKGTLRAAKEHDLLLEPLSRNNTKTRYPTVKLGHDEVALLEPDAGVLDPERAVLAHLKMAEQAGAKTCFGATMERWEATSNGFDLHLADGRHVSASKLVLALGPWFREMLQSLGIPIRVQRNVQAWFSPATKVYDAPGFPAFLVDRPGLPAPLYGFPDFGDGVKAAFHGLGDLTEANQIDREVNFSRDIEPIVKAMEQWMPGATKTFRAAKPCMYTLTPDANFVVDRHPDHPNLILCGGFSGHGFKFAPVIGEIGADLALQGGSRHLIDFLSLRRFASAAN
ncbi:MAG: sarcosine oxidase [Verrucomicrobiota bacterium]